MILVITFNVRHTCNSSITIIVQRSVSNLLITGPEQVTKNTTEGWTFDLGTIGSDACYMVSQTLPVMPLALLLIPQSLIALLLIAQLLIALLLIALLLIALLLIACPRLHVCTQSTD